MSRVCFVAICFVLGTASLHAEMPLAMGFPETPGGRTLHSWWVCANEAEASKRREFLTNGFTEKGDAAVERRQDFMENLIGIELVRILHDEERKIEAVFQRDGKMIRVVIIASDAPPHSIHSVMMVPYENTHQKEPARTVSQVADELSAYLNDLTAKEEFSGAVLLARGDQIVHRQAYGLASRRFDTPNRVDTKFNLGSMNKMFTAVGILQLVQDGRLRLDDRVSQYVDDSWLPKEITEKIQIRHLLCHTSGLGNYFNDEFAKTSRELVRELDDYKPMLADESLAFEPGTQWQYSNTGMLILGVVISEVSGRDYFEYIRDRVYRPARMDDTDCYDMDEPVPNLAIGYFKKDGRWNNNLFRHVIRGGPAGGGYSTVDDLHRFAKTLLAFKFLDAEHTRKLVSPKPGSPGYGYGFEIARTSKGVVIGHGGGFPGIHSKLDIFPDSGFIAVVLSNQDEAAGPVVEKVRQLVGSVPSDR